MRHTRTKSRAARGARRFAVLTGVIALAVAPTLVGASSANASPAVKCDVWGCSNQQPVVSPPAVPFGPSSYPVLPPAGGWTNYNPPPAVDVAATGDWDHDGVPNWKDNCPIVPNSDQAPAVRPASAVDDPLAVQWKAQNPGAFFRLNSQLGEACSGWNGNWRLTEEAEQVAPETVKNQLFALEANGGPMFGNNKLMYGGPVCTTVNGGWVNMLEYAVGLPQINLPLPDSLFSCQTGGIATPFTNFIEDWVWSGKRLFTPTNAGGTITNRFFAPITESPFFLPLVGLFPSLFPHGDGQTVNGSVIRGSSYEDGNPVSIMDWRQVSGAGLGSIPLPNLSDIPIVNTSFLVYDECRGMQEGIWTCTANADVRHGDKTIPGKTFQFGWMMWQDIDPSTANWDAWKAANPAVTLPGTYGFGT